MVIKLIDDNNIGIFLKAYNPRVVGLLKSMPGARFSARLKTWFLPIDGTASQTIKTLATRGAEVDPRVLSRLVEFEAATGQIEPSFSSDLPLYPYQREICSFLFKNPYALNASFVGSGKTLTSLAVCEAVGATRVLIIAPKSVVLQWAQQQIPLWLPDATISVSTTDLSKKYLVVGYERARIDIETLAGIEWDVIITDEAHRLANPGTKLYKALMKLKARRRIALTATPVMNRAEDMYGIINWLKPGALGSYYQFINRYIVKGGFQGKQIVDHKNMRELALRCQPYIIRKTLDEVDMELPPYTETILPIELGDVERKNYNLIRKELLFDIELSIINKIINPVMLQTSVVKLGKLFELCDSMELLGENTESSKLEVLKEHLESTTANGNKVIVITRFRRMVDILARELASYNPLCITGQTSDRQTILDLFQTSTDHKILIGTEAIAQGLNLQVANILYNYDSAWNPAKMEQRAGRIYRNGQTKPVFIYNLVVNKSVEGWLQKKLVTKAELSASLLPKSYEEIKEILE